MLRVLCFTVVALVGCGGAIQEDDASSQNDDAKTTFSAPGAAPAALSPYGSWDLVSLDGDPNGKQTTQTFGHLFLELRSDGTAVARRCTKPYYEPGTISVRCSDSSAYDCVYGTIRWDEDVWRVDLPGLRQTAKESRGEIFADLGGEGIVVRHILPQYSAGHFIRMDDSPTNACAGPSGAAEPTPRRRGDP